MKTAGMNFQRVHSGLFYPILLSVSLRIFPLIRLLFLYMPAAVSTGAGNFRSDPSLPQTESGMPRSFSQL